MENKMYFASNADKNGNTYQAIIDNDNKTIKKGYFLFRWKDQITMPKAKIKQMIEQYKQQGYKEVED
jgi:hypothetical protein